MRAAGKATGHSPDYIKIRCDNAFGGWRWVTTPAAPPKSGPKASPYVIRGTSYKSSIQAGKVLGLSPSSIRLAAKLGRLDEVGLTPKGPKSAIPVTDGATIYPTLTSAGAAIGIRADRLKKMIERGETKFRFITKES